MTAETLTLVENGASDKRFTGPPDRNSMSDMANGGGSGGGMGIDERIAQIEKALPQLATKDDLRGTASETKSDIIKWLSAIVIAVGMAVITTVGIIANNIRPAPPASTPIVINVPALPAASEPPTKTERR